MAHQDTTSKLNEDQPPAYPHNDKPPDYHDVCPQKTITPPPVEIDPPENPPTVLTTILTVTPSPVYNTDFTTTTTTATTIYHPPERFVVTEAPTSNSHHHNEVTESQDASKQCNKVLWIILLILSVIAAIIVPIIGIHACVWACIGYHADDKDLRRQGAVVAIIMCTITYVGIIVTVIVISVVFSSV